MAGTKEYQGYLNKKQEESINFALPYLAQAVKTAENNKRNHGVLSVPIATPEEAGNVVNNSVYNNFVRWIQARQGQLPAWDMPRGASPNDKFVDFMQKRWAPVPAENDPEFLNKNWAPNVRSILKRILGPEEYRRWEMYNMVQLPMDRGVA